MALLYRFIGETDVSDVVGRAPALFEAWLKRKTRRPTVTAGDAQFVVKSRGGGDTRFEIATVEDAGEEASVWRGRCFEAREGGEEVRTTFTAIRGADASWAWVDVERWTSDAFSPGWVPLAPVLVVDILAAFPIRRERLALPASVRHVEAERVGELFGELMSPNRSSPMVVVSPTKEEREGDFGPCVARAEGLQRHLAGVAPVITLGPGATSDLSRRLTEALGVGWDVHSGAARSYLPRLDRGTSARHRAAPFSRLARRDADAAGRLLSLPLIQGACEVRPPAIWREHGRHLAAFSPGKGGDISLEEYVADLGELERERDEALGDAARFSQAASLAEEAQAEAYSEVEALAARVDYLAAELAKKDPGAVHAFVPSPAFEPDYCGEVVEHARETLTYVDLLESVDAGADALDVHAQSPAWARKAWRALRALEAYAEAKLAGSSTGDFKRWCEQSDSPHVLQGSWVGLHEAEGTRTNRTFRSLRTFAVPAGVEASGSVYMEAHIRLQQGGTPCPRIHFYDDTDGETGRLFVGWFGDHLDSAAKS